MSRSSYHPPWEELQSVDAFVFGVCSLYEGVFPGAFAVRTPAQVEAIATSWPDDGHPQFTEVARPPRSAVIDPEELESEVPR